MIGSFLLGFPPSLLGAFIFTIISYLGKEFIFRCFKDYRCSYNNLTVEKQNFIDMFKDLKNQKIILDFIEWKRKYHLAPVIFQDYRTKNSLDFEVIFISALASKDYTFAADLFVQFNERIENAQGDKQNKILQYREKLEAVELKQELEMEMPILKKKVNVKDML